MNAYIAPSEAEREAGYYFVDATKRKHYECSICLGTIQNPAFSGCSQDHSFCWNCLIQLAGGGRFNCPICRESLRPSVMRDACSVKRVMDTEFVHCCPKENNCAWKGRLGELAKHKREECDFEKQKCILCYVGIPRHRFEAHLLRCKNEVVTCHKCGEHDIKREDLEAHFIDQCKETEVRKLQ